MVVALSCQANVSDGTANQLPYNWRKDGEVFATDSGAGGASIITTTESGTYDVLISHPGDRSNKYGYLSFLGEIYFV